MPDHVFPPLRELIGDVDEFMAQHERFRRSMEFVADHAEQIEEAYDGEWIGVYDGEVIASDREHTELLSVLRRSGVHIGSTLIQKVESNPPVWIL